MEEFREALDVWLKIPEGEEESEYEANTYRADGGGFDVELYHTAVGLVHSKWFASRRAARRWLTDHGFLDFTA